MPAIDGRHGLSDPDYDAVEAAVMETPKGRWFLAEHARRNRVADTQTLLEALRKIETAVAPQGGQAELGPLISAIKQTRAEIAAVRNHMLEDGGVLADDPKLYEAISEGAQIAAGELMTRTDTLQMAAGLLKDTGADTNIIELETGGLQSLAWQQDVLSQRIAKALGLLDHLSQRLEAIAGTGAAPIPKLTETHLKLFERDEDVFAVEDPVVIRHVPLPSPVAESPRIVFIRRPSAEGPPMPDENDSAA
jgi:hypothetical protein